MANTTEGRQTRGGEPQGEVQVQKGQPSQLQQAQARRVRPAVDIFENHDEILLYADLPGVQPDDLDIRLENGLLSIEGRRTVSAGGRQTQQAWVYSRQFQLPGGTDADKIQGELRQGVLELHLPKRDQVKPRQIKVNAG